MKKQGFTLAEVLTTLMVIGVVAAMTIPTLMNSTRQQQDEVAYKKAMSVLSQAVQLLVAQEEECLVTNSNQLAACFANNVLAGARGAVGDDTGNVITTADGMAYAFYYTGTYQGAAERDIATICGNNAVRTAGNSDSWAGASERCYVIVDVNGTNRGASEFGDVNAPAGTAFPVAALEGTEQYPFSITAAGATPICIDAAAGEETTTGSITGCQYVYGDDFSVAAQQAADPADPVDPDANAGEGGEQQGGENP